MSVRQVSVALRARGVLKCTTAYGNQSANVGERSSQHKSFGHRRRARLICLKGIEGQWVSAQA